MRRTGRYISEDFIRGFGENYVIKLDAHLGSGKTSSLEQFKGLKVLYIASSTQLIEQICQRYEWLETYIEKDGKTRKTTEHHAQYHSNRNHIPTTILP